MPVNVLQLYLLQGSLIMESTQGHHDNQPLFMNRKEFLKTVMYGTAALGITACIGSCLSGCSDDVTAPSNVDFTLDLTLAANAALLTTGGYLVSNGIIVARTGTNQFTAVSAKCTHEGTQVAWQQSNNRFYCSNHGATFTSAGVVTGGPASKNLTQYNTTLTGNSLRVFS